MADPRESSGRLPAIPASQMTQAQRDAVQALLKTPRAGLRGPFTVMLYSPELMNRAQQLGEYLRFAGQIPVKLREFAILIAARHWTQRYEWYVHAPLAENAGVSRAIIDELAMDRRPAGMDVSETVIYDFCTELHRTHGVSEETYSATHRLLGDAGIVDLCGLCGYYAMLAMLLNVARTELPEGAQPPF